ncbi:DUF773 domain-containing protein [Leptospira sp. WS92.C1]
MSQSTFEIFSEKFLINHKQVTVGKWFGLESLNLNGKPFAAFFQGELVFKIGAEKIAQILSQYPGAKLFDPSGRDRAMKDWLQIPAGFENDWSQLAESALSFLISASSQTATPAKKKAIKSAPKKTTPAKKKKVASKKKSAPKSKKAVAKKKSVKAKKAVKAKPKKSAPKKKVAKKKTSLKKRKK